VAGKSSEERQKFRAHGAPGAVKFPLCIFRFSTAAAATAVIIRVRRETRRRASRYFASRFCKLACSPAVVAVDSKESTVPLPRIRGRIPRKRKLPLFLKSWRSRWSSGNYERIRDV